MIETGRAVEIVSGILPRMRRFPRGQSAQVATLAECGKLLADRCQTEQQAADYSREFSNRREGWQGTEQFSQWLTASLSDIPPDQQRSLASIAHNSICEPLRCRDKFIGWCGKPYPAALIDQGRKYPHLTLLELAQLGRACMDFSREAEREVWTEILQLPAEQRAALEVHARREWAGTIEAAESMLRWCMCLSFEEWRKTACV